MRADQAEVLDTLERTRASLSKLRRKHRADIQASISESCRLLALRADQDFDVRPKVLRLRDTVEMHIRGAERLRAAKVPFAISLKQVRRICAIAQRLLHRRAGIEKVFLERARLCTKRVVANTVSRMPVRPSRSSFSRACRSVSRYVGSLSTSRTSAR
ncbi:hypothetical protein D3C79_855090 [compost metagenome]